MTRETDLECHDSEVRTNFSLEDFNDEKYTAMEALEKIQEITTASAAMLQCTRLMDSDILDSARERSFDVIATLAASHIPAASVLEQQTLQSLLLQSFHADQQQQQPVRQTFHRSTPCRVNPSLNTAAIGAAGAPTLLPAKVYPATFSFFNRDSSNIGTSR
ncbi:hypothetical protein Gpo141_00011272 [Globisporangium polare]